jgi:hypothetical protein
MNKRELALKITELIKDEIPLFPLGDMLAYDPFTFNPVINIMESDENHAKRFHIEVVDVTDIKKNARFNRIEVEKIIDGVLEKDNDIEMTGKDYLKIYYPEDDE